MIVSIKHNHSIATQEGSGLGKSEQGMSKALLVEKTSKRGGRIIKGIIKIERYLSEEGNL